MLNHLFEALLSTTLSVLQTRKPLDEMEAQVIL